MRGRWGAVFFAVGFGCLAVACVAAARRAGGAPLPGAGALAAAAALTAAGLLAAAAGWASLLRGHAPAAVLARDFMLSQVAKYIPGGVWLGVGQVGLAVRAGIPAPRAVGALVACGACFVAAAGAATGVAAGVAALLSPGGPYPPVLAAGLLLPLVLHRRWMTAIAGRVARRAGGAAVVPGQRRILGACGWSLLSVGCSAATFAVLINAVVPVPAPIALSAFVAAWLAGFLALGAPSGIGAREAALVALLAPTGAGTAAVLTACLAQRIVQMLAEAGLAASAHLVVGRAPRLDTHPSPMEAPHA